MKGLVLVVSLKKNSGFRPFHGRFWHVLSDVMSSESKFFWVGRRSACALIEGGSKGAANEQDTACVIEPQAVACYIL